MVDWTKYDHILNLTSVIAALITTSLGLSFFINQHKYPQKLSAKPQKMAASASISCYAISMITIAVRDNVGASDPSSLTYLIGFLIHVFFWGLGISAALALFIFREHSTFKATAYKSPTYVYVSLYSGIVLFLICHAILVAEWVLHFYGVISASSKDRIHSIELSVKGAAVVYVSLMLMYLFVSKLMRHSVVLFVSYEQVSMSPAIQQQALMPQIALSKREHNFLQIATKMTVLSSCMAMSSVSLIALALTSSLCGDSFLGGFLWYFGAMLGLMIDSTINALCIYLTLPYKSSKRLYACCCRRTCHSCCFRVAKSRLQLQKQRKMSDVLLRNTS